MPEEPPTPPTPAKTPGDVPPEGRRRLDRPPSERFGVEAGAAGSTGTPARGSLGRAVAFALVPALAGVALFTLLAGPLAIDAGLVVVAAAMGLAIGRAVWMGGRGGLSGGQRIGLAVVIFLIALLGAELATWQFALTEGGVLGPIDYLRDTFGGLVVLEILAGLVGAVIAAA